MLPQVSTMVGPPSVRSEVPSLAGSVMNSEHSVDTNPKIKPITSLSVLGARLTWIFAGPVALLFAAYGIVVAGSGWLTLLDAAFLAIVLFMLLGRWTEQRSGCAMTVYGDRPQPQQYRRYMTTLPVVAIAIWISANVLGNHLLK